MKYESETICKFTTSDEQGFAIKKNKALLENLRFGGNFKEVLHDPKKIARLMWIWRGVIDTCLVVGYINSGTGLFVFGLFLHFFC